MNIETAIVSAIGASLLAPFAVLLWKRLFPPSRVVSAEEAKSALSRRNIALWRITRYVQGAAFFGPLSLYAMGYDRSEPWPLILSFSLATCAPLLFLLAASTPSGLGRAKEIVNLLEIFLKTDIRIVIMLSTIGVAFTIFSGLKIIQ